MKRIIGIAILAVGGGVLLGQDALQQCLTDAYTTNTYYVNLANSVYDSAITASGTLWTSCTSDATNAYTACYAGWNIACDGDPTCLSTFVTTICAPQQSTANTACNTTQASANGDLGRSKPIPLTTRPPRITSRWRRATSNMMVADADPVAAAAAGGVNATAATASTVRNVMTTASVRVGSATEIHAAM